MKFRLFAYLTEALLCAVRGEDENPADMFLPDRLLSMSVVFLSAAVVSVIIALLRSHAIGWYLAAAAALALGVSAFLCWRNQKICILSDEEFTCTTMFGKSRTYRFDEIVALRKNNDSFTLIMKDGKVHIESMAILSDRLIEQIDAQFR
ncbi:MAG: hypothetical protein IKU34_00295 [Clostridia bacterium]|nr:hypothetical protein [Clostridia bacterium]